MTISRDNFIFQDPLFLMNVKARNWITFAITIVLVGLVSSFFQLPVLLPLSVLILFVYIYYFSNNRFYVDNFYMIIVSYFLISFIYRVQVGFGVYFSSNLISIITQIMIVMLFFVSVTRLAFHSNINFIVLICLLFIASIYIQAFNGFDIEKLKLALSISQNYMIFIIGYYLYKINSKYILHGTLRMLLVISIIDASYGLFQFIFGLPVYEVNAIHATGTDTAVFFASDFIKIIGLNSGTYGLFYSLIFFIILFFTELKKYIYKSSFLLSGLLSLVLLFTFTERTALIMFFVAMVTFYILKYSKGKLVFIFLILLLFVILFPYLLHFYKDLFNNIADIGSTKFERLGEISDVLEAGTMKSRQAHWENALMSFKKSGIWGNGFDGEYGFHNEYINIIVTFGIYSFLLWVVFLVSIVKKLFVLFKYETDPVIKNISISLICLFFSFLAAAIPNNPFIYSCGFIFFLFTGMIISYFDNLVKNS